MRNSSQLIPRSIRRALVLLATRGALGVSLLCGCSSGQVVGTSSEEIDGIPSDWPGRPTVTGTITASWPQVETRTLGGERAGTAVHLVAVPRRDSPALFLRWVLPGGRSLEFAGTGKSPQQWPEGTVQLAAELVQMGTRSHPGTAFASALADLGAQVDVLAVPDAVVIDVHVLGNRLPQVLELVREMLLQPQLDGALLNALKDRHVGDLKSDAQSPERVAQRVARRLLFGAQHPYGSPGLTLESVGKITRKHVQDAAALAMRLGDSHLIAVGDVDMDGLAAAVDRVFAPESRLPRAMVALPAPVSETTASGCHVVSIPGTTQNALVMATVGPSRADALWPALQLANQVLGGSASSRLFTELREKRGLGYGATSWLEGRKVGGGWMLTANVRTEVSLSALDVVQTQLRLLANQAPELEEMQAAQRFLAGQFAMRLADGDDLADLLAVTPMYGLADGKVARYLDDLQSLGPNDLPPLAARWVQAEDAIVVVAGNPEGLRPALDARCDRVVEHDAQGKVVRVLVGRDKEMTHASRGSTFALWTRSPEGLRALERFVTQPSHAALYRAQALAMLGASPESRQVLELGRKAADWPLVCAEMVKMMLARLGTRSPAENAEIRRTVLELADTATRTDGGPRDLTPEAADAARQVLAQWALYGTTAGDPDAQVTQAARLSPGDLKRLGQGVAPATLGGWIGANVRRHEAAEVLMAQDTPEAHAALIAGYRAFLSDGTPPDAEDLAAISSAGSADALVLLLGVHAGLERTDNVAAQLATMQTIRREVAALKADDLVTQFERIGPFMEALLVARNADDRWWAAEMLVHHAGMDGLRRVLQDMAQDGHYRDPKWHTVDPKEALARLVQKALVPEFGARMQPHLLATLVRRHTMGKVIAVAALKTLGDDASLAALKTVMDESDVSALLDLQAPLTVHEMALAAVDVIKFVAGVNTEEKAGKLDASTALRYREAALGTVDLFDKRLRQEVNRIVTRGPALVPDAAPVAPQGTPE